MPHYLYAFNDLPMTKAAIAGAITHALDHCRLTYRKAMVSEPETNWTGPLHMAPADSYYIGQSHGYTLMIVENNGTRSYVLEGKVVNSGKLTRAGKYLQDNLLQALKVMKVANRVIAVYEHSDGGPQQVEILLPGSVPNIFWQNQERWRYIGNANLETGEIQRPDRDEDE